jgi:hypothetical protein
MPETQYPVICHSCTRSLNGPVKYCPFCGVHDKVAPTEEKGVEEIVVGKTSQPAVEAPVVEVAAQAPPPVPPVETPPSGAEGLIQKTRVTTSPSPPPAEHVERVPPARKPWKGIALVVALVVVLAGYLFSHQKAGPLVETSSGPSTTPASGQLVEPSSVPKSPGGTAQKQGQRDAARGLALDALRQGTDLSVAITKLPKLEKVREAAQSLGEISPRYQEQIASAESTVAATRKNRDNSLMAYIRKVVELGRYTPEQISYATELIRNGDQGPRDKAVTELLAKHVDALRANAKVNSKKILSDFTRSFSDFVD